MSQATEGPRKDASSSNTVRKLIFSFLGLFVFFFLLSSIPFFEGATKENREEAQCLKLVERPIIDTIFVHYVLHKEGDSFYQNIVEDRSGELSFLALNRALTIGATYEVAVNCVSAIIKAELESPKPSKKSTPKNPAPIARGFRFRNLL